MTAYIHVGVSSNLAESICLYDALAPTWRPLLVDMFGDARYYEELTDSFLCNPARTEPSARRPTVVADWERVDTTGNLLNPQAVSFVHATADNNGDGREDLPVGYEWFDGTGQLIASGSVVIQDMTDEAFPVGEPWVEFWPDDAGQLPWRGRYRVLPDGPRDATLQLDVGAPFDPGVPPGEHEPTETNYSTYGRTVEY